MVARTMAGRDNEVRETRLLAAGGRSISRVDRAHIQLALERGRALLVQSQAERRYPRDHYVKRQAAQ
jgi:hypothetical protein